MQLVQLAAGTPSGAIREVLGDKHMSDLMDIVEGGIGIRLPNGNLSFLDEDDMDGELRSQYLGG